MKIIYDIMNLSNKSQNVKIIIKAIEKETSINPILHTAWLDNYALTLKSNSAKYYFHEKSRFFTYLPKISLLIKENLC